MSKALLKQSLDIVEEGLGTVAPLGDKFRKGTKSGRNPFAPPSQTEQRAEYRGTIAKKPKAKQLVNKQPQRPATTVTQKSAIQLAHEHLLSGQQRADDNLRKLLLLSGAKPMDAAVTDKLVRRAQNRRYVIDAEKPKADESTAFTDEDFAKFEREYFG